MTIETNVVGGTIQKVKITVPEQTSKPVREAHTTAKVLNKDSRLATVAEAIHDTQTLRNAKGRYLLAVDSKNLPANAGWYLVQRQTDNISFKPMFGKQAQILINEGRWDEVLYVNQSAVNAAKESRPLVLLFYGNGLMWYLVANDWPDVDARVALANPVDGKTNASQPAKIKGFLRDADAAEKVILRLHERFATTREIEMLQKFVRTARMKLETK